MGEIILSRGEQIPVVKGSPHDERARESHRAVSTLLSRHDRRENESCVAVRLDE